MKSDVLTIGAIAAAEKTAAVLFFFDTKPYTTPARAPAAVAFTMQVNIVKTG